MADADHDPAEEIKKGHAVCGSEIKPKSGMGVGGMVFGKGVMGAGSKGGYGSPAVGLSGSRVVVCEGEVCSETSTGGLPLEVIEKYRAENQGAGREGHHHRDQAGKNPSEDHRPRWKPR